MYFFPLAPLTENKAKIRLACETTRSALKKGFDHSILILDANTSNMGHSDYHKPTPLHSWSVPRGAACKTHLPVSAL